MAHLVCAAAFSITAWLITLLATFYEVLFLFGLVYAALSY